jgi:glycosyltransferase involved in cell wall biosynthesis
MSDHPRVSVVVPFFDSEGHIAACIESLLGQEGVTGALEIIFVDNGSRDASPSIVQGYGDELTVLEESTPGAYAARNAGIRRARAPLVAFTDADCVVDRDWLRSVQDGMKDPTVAVLLGHCRYPAHASLTLRVLEAYENAKAEYVIDLCGPAHRFAYANNMAVRASVFEEIGLFREWRRAADSELVHRLASRRPDLRLAYRRSMRVTHMEFVRARERARRLSLYTRTNARIETFRELGLAHRLGVLRHLLRGPRGGT